MGGICFCGCGCQSENPFVCFSEKPTQWACARDLPGDRKKTREGRSHRQWARQKSQQKGAEETRATEQVIQEMRGKQWGDQSTTVRNAAARTCWPTDAELINARKWVSIPSGLVEVSRKYTLAIDCKWTNFPPLALGAIPSLIDCSSFLPLTPLCILYFGKEM